MRVVGSLGLPALLNHATAALAGPSTHVLISGEVRDEGLFDHFIKIVSAAFTVTRVARKKFHPNHVDDMVYILQLRKRRDL